MEESRFTPFSYKSCLPPAGYSCSKCGVSSVKLWRQYQTLADQIELLCLECACKDQDKDPAEVWKRSDQIGWLVPAVPTEDGDTFWGYTSVPQTGCVWWHRLEPASPRERDEWMRGSTLYLVKAEKDSVGEWWDNAKKEKDIPFTAFGLVKCNYTITETVMDQETLDWMKTIKGWDFNNPPVQIERWV